MKRTQEDTENLLGIVLQCVPHARSPGSEQQVAGLRWCSINSTLAQNSNNDSFLEVFFLIQVALSNYKELSNRITM